MKIETLFFTIICILLMTLVYFISKTFVKSDKGDTFHPIRVLTFYFFIQMIFPLFYSFGITDLDSDDAYIFSQKLDWSLESGIFFLNHFLLYASIISSYVFFSSKSNLLVIFNEKLKSQFGFLILFFIISVVSFFLAVGNPILYFQDFENRQEILKGNAIFLIIFQALSFLLIPLTVRKKQGIFSYLFLPFILFSSFFSGSRTSIIANIIAVVISYHYQISRIKINFSPRLVILLSITSIILFLIPTWRTGGRANIDTPALAKDLSTFRTALVVNHEVLQNGLWLGLSYIDFFGSFIPRNLNPDKAPVDEGVYINALADMQNVRPPMSASELPLTSWPLGNLALYLNFSYFGTIFGGTIIGFVYSCSYKLILKSNFSNYHLSHYIFLCIGVFAFSNLYIINALFFFLFTSLFAYFFSIRVQRG